MGGFRMRSSAIRGALSAARFSRQIVSYAAGAAATSSPGATSIAVPWPTSAGSVSANVRNFMAVAQKPGTANGGAVATASGWTPILDYIGGGYGGTAGGNSRIYLFYKDNDNTTTGSESVALTPDGANGVACASISRFEKLKGSWQAMATATAEATANGVNGTYTPGAMIIAPGDVLITALAFHDALFSSVSVSAPSLTLSGMLPNPALSWGQASGYGVGYGIFPLRMRRGGKTLGSLTFTLPNGDCRGPLVVARLRVR